MEHPRDRVYEKETWEKVKVDALRALTGHLALDYRLSRKSPLLKAEAKGISRRPDRVAVDNSTSDF